MTVFIIIIIYILSVILARYVNYFVIKKGISPDRYVSLWFTPVFNLIFSVIEISGLIYKCTKFSKFVDIFTGEYWVKKTLLDPNVEDFLNSVDIKEIEQYLRKNKLKKLK